MTAYVFTITSLETGQTLGAALICPEARYASIAWRGEARIDRKFLTPAAWKGVLEQLHDRLPPGPLEEASALVQAFELLSRGLVIQYQSQEPIGTGDELVAVPALDARLRAAGTEFRLEMQA